MRLSFWNSGGVTDTKAWYKKRLKRIFVPYEMFVLLLFIIHAVCGLNLLNIDWVWLILGLQGSVVGVLGAEQTWFITPLLLCYAITPLLDRYITLQRTKMQIGILVIAAVGMKLLWAIPESPVCDTLLSLVSVYIIAFVVGRFFDKLTFSKAKALVVFVVMCIAFVMRLVARYFCDGTVFYDRIACGYTQSLAVFGIFYLFVVLFQNIQPPPQGGGFIGEISFEVYLVHYMFCVGPVRLFGLTPYWVVNCILVTIISVVLAMILHGASCSVLKKLR
ncbi:MAG: acyltransferase family protein [Lachnospiraceae bacterium]